MYFKNCIPVEAAQLLGRSICFISYSEITKLYLLCRTSLLSVFLFLLFLLLPVYVKEFPSICGQAWTGSAPGINYIRVHSFLL